MRKARWLAPWKDLFERPVIHHCVTRVADRKFAFGKEEKEKEKEKETLEIVMNAEGERDLKGMKRAVANAELAQLERGRNVAMRKMLHYRVRYFTDGAVIGSREFVDEVFRSARERFGPKRKTGARKLRGAGGAAAGLIWGARDLRKEIG